MINVLFFAQTRELIGQGSIQLKAQFATVEALRSHLASQPGKWDLALQPGKLLVAVNQTIVAFDYPLSDGDEVAFFPPVTGG
ncbi:molybdopterin synthase sulfur carrier subunit [Vibrio ordalii]|uniref:molybdopterin synthase sulfur carrier subunit n=1 Tax=Vibrio ordalii TaxID=28174 RepID=UPI0025762AB5|nr:molybdopterin synthase sulfur carrier subunit [Vibrio ordalii]MCS0350352.1 molybdopterin synthase sulfur carrier subunit [Vibrio ordalii]